MPGHLALILQLRMTRADKGARPCVKGREGRGSLFSVLAEVALARDILGDLHLGVGDLFFVDGPGARGVGGGAGDGGNHGVLHWAARSSVETRDTQQVCSRGTAHREGCFKTQSTLHAQLRGGTERGLPRAA